MLFNSLQRRSLARQTGTVNFHYDASIDNTTGICSFGLSGLNPLMFKASSGKLYDPNGKFVSSYVANQSFSVSGQVRGSLLDYSVNNELVGLGVAVSSGNYDWLVISPKNCSAEVEASILGELPDYSIIKTGKYYTAHSQVSAALINNNPARPFRIFSATAPLQNSPFSVVGFTTGDVTGTAHIQIQSSLTGLRDYVVPLALETNFGNVSFNFNVSGDYTQTPRFYLSLFPQSNLIEAGGSADMDIDFSNYPVGMPLSVSLEYVSGATGNLYKIVDVADEVSSRLVSGLVTGYAKIAQEHTGLITGTGSFGDSWSTTGSGIFQSDYVYPTGLLSEIWTATVYGNGAGVIGGVTFLDLPVYGFITGLITGEAVSGAFDYDFAVTGQPQYSGYPPGYSGLFSNQISGYRRASATVLIDEMAYGDYISLEGFTTSYNPYEPAPPYLFGSMGNLIDIFNEYPMFGVTASQSSGPAGVSGVMALSAIDIDEAGNIPIAAFGGIRISGDEFGDESSLTGGATLYYPVSALYGAYYAGRAVGRISATGHLTATGWGILTGQTEVIDRIRTFTGTWGLETGGVDYLSVGLVSSITLYDNPVIHTFSGLVNTVAVRTSYSDDYIPGYPDMARLTVTGVGTNSGVQITFSGIY